jgi:hypothetical protein
LRRIGLDGGNSSLDLLVTIDRVRRPSRASDVSHGCSQATALASCLWTFVRASAFLGNKSLLLQGRKMTVLTDYRNRIS